MRTWKSIFLLGNILLYPVFSESPGPLEEKALLHQVINEPQRDETLFRVTGFLNGLKEFDEGRIRKESGLFFLAKAHFEKSLEAFQRSFELSYPLDKPLAAFCLKFQIQTCLELDTETFFQKGLEIVNSLLNDYRQDLFSTLQHPDEIFFFQGVLAGKVSFLENEEAKKKMALAEKAFHHVIQNYPKSTYYGDAIDALGKLYYLHFEWRKAQEVFELALESVLLPEKEAEYLFLMGNISEQMGKKELERQYYRKKLYETYPSSPFAAEAYFRCYSYSDYVAGRQPAFDHLLSFCHRYPDSPYTLNALYLIGINALNDKKKGLQRLQKGSEILWQIDPLFDQLSLKKAIPKDQWNYYTEIRYRAILDAAAAELSFYEASLPEKPWDILQNRRLENSLKQMVQELENPLSPFYGEAMFLLIRNDSIQHRNEKARNRCTYMIQHYQNANMTKNRHLAKIFGEYAKIALRSNDPKTAIEYFKMADKAGDGGLLTIEERLDLWIEMALSYQAIGNLEEAMLTLSHVVNYNAISSRRLKAMYYRAMIYEAQERRELARNQLETVAKTQGEWAQKAKIYLKENYAYR